MLENVNPVKAESKAPAYLEQLLESKKLERCPFPIPSSWFFVDFSDNLKAGEVRNITLFDQEWVLFRGESGKVGMTDPTVLTSGPIWATADRSAAIICAVRFITGSTTSMGGARRFHTPKLRRP